MTDINDAKRALLSEYEKEKNELDMIISRLRRELGMAVVEPPSEPEEERVPTGLPTGTASVNELIQPGDLFGMTQVQATIEFLKRAKQPCSIRDIAQALYRGKAVDTPIDGTSLRNLSSVLSRADELISIARGRWGLKDWYPNRAVKKARKSLAERTEEIMKQGPTSFADAAKKAEAETKETNND
jgi:hypothetical protein